MDNREKGAIFFSDRGQNLTEIEGAQSLTEETVDLSTLFISDVSASGSFDLRHSRLSFFQKFLEAIPIPVLLVDESCRVTLANRASRKVTGDRERIEGNHFKLLFPSSVDRQQVEKLIAKVFHNRIPLVAEGVVGTDQIRIRGRVHMRPIRVKDVRTVLVVIEDLTPSAKKP